MDHPLATKGQAGAIDSEGRGGHPKDRTQRSRYINSLRTLIFITRNACDTRLHDLREYKLGGRVVWSDQGMSERGTVHTWGRYSYQGPPVCISVAAITCCTPKKTCTLTSSFANGRLLALRTFFDGIGADTCWSRQMIKLRSGGLGRQSGVCPKNTSRHCTSTGT